MNKHFTPYKTESVYKENNIKFFFESIGKTKIIKTIEYSSFRIFDGKRVFNLGFGDYDAVAVDISDDVNSNNDDMYKVFYTVLSSVPLFFKQNPNDAIWVQGSDSSENFINNCKPNCKKKCKQEECKNINRRIKTYRSFVNRNFEDLSKDYIFFGMINDSLVQYIPNHEYLGILVFKKK